MHSACAHQGPAAARAMRPSRPAASRSSSTTFGGTVYISGFPRPQKRSWLASLEAHPGFTFPLKHDLVADLPATARSITDAAERLPILDQVKNSQTSWADISIEDAVKLAPLVEVTFKE